MAQSCSIAKSERYTRMALGAGYVLAGFLLRRNALVAVSAVTVGSAMVVAASLGR